MASTAVGSSQSFTYRDPNTAKATSANIRHFSCPANVTAKISSDQPGWEAQSRTVTLISAMSLPNELRCIYSVDTASVLPGVLRARPASVTGVSGATFIEKK
jgi:hypothetical protein